MPSTTFNCDTTEPLVKADNNEKKNKEISWNAFSLPLAENNSEDSILINWLQNLVC